MKSERALLDFQCSDRRHIFRALESKRKFDRTARIIGGILFFFCVVACGFIFLIVAGV
jgi:hypothetical protein